MVKNTALLRTIVCPRKALPRGLTLRGYLTREARACGPLPTGEINLRPTYSQDGDWARGRTITGEVTADPGTLARVRSRVMLSGCVHCNTEKGYINDSKCHCCQTEVRSVGKPASGGGQLQLHISLAYNGEPYGKARTLLR